jgi:hypothetical protein
MIDWATIILEGREIVDSYSTPVTLRQLHYRLVAVNVGGYTNSIGCYKQLSARTAKLRRTGEFPSLADNGRAVSRPMYHADTKSALLDVAQRFRLDRTDGQEFQTWLLFEKATLFEQFWSWTSPYGIPIAALRGYSSETLEAEVCDGMDDDGRPVIVYYVGDLDSEGEDIERNFQDQATSRGIEVDEWVRLAVNAEQIEQLGLVPNPGKPSSSRAAGFVRKYGQLFQIETEAIDPGELEQLISGAVTDPNHFDEDAYEAVREVERAQRERLKAVADGWESS